LKRLDYGQKTKKIVDSCEKIFGVSVNKKGIKFGDKNVDMKGGIYPNNNDNISL
jgi:hypothetical protein